jgi:hypothetical protein
VADSIGIDAETGQVMVDWSQTEQSVRKILTTWLTSRVMRREFGSLLLDHVDQKMTNRAVLSLYVAAATAIRRWEPRFRMKGGNVLKAEVSGVIELVISGIYYPRGHRGDYSVAEDASVRVVLGASS